MHTLESKTDFMNCVLITSEQLTSKLHFKVRGTCIVVNCATRSFLTRTGEMREANAANETVIEGEVTCARESMEVRGIGKGSITYVAKKNLVF